MTTIPIARYLGRFSRAAAPAASERLEPETDAGPPPAEREAALLGEREAARSQGFQQGEAKAAAAAEEMLAAERRSAQVRLAAERACWASEEGERLAQATREGLEAVETRLCEQVARILQQFAEASLRIRIVDALKATLSGLLAGDRPAVVRISGPGDLVAAMRGCAAGTAKAIEYVETDAVDVSIVADDTLIESQLDAWMSQFREASA